jgi:anti-sigma B factor antagonist
VGGIDDDRLLTVSTSERSEAVIVVVVGEVDISTVPRLRTVVHEAVERLGGRPLVVDLTGVEFLGSAGLHVLAETAAAAGRRAAPSPLRVAVRHGGPVMRPIELSGLDTILSVYPSVEDALTG